MSNELENELTGLDDILDESLDLPDIIDPESEDLGISDDTLNLDDLLDLDIEEPSTAPTTKFAITPAEDIDKRDILGASVFLKWIKKEENAYFISIPSVTEEVLKSNRSNIPITEITAFKDQMYSRYISTPEYSDRPEVFSCYTAYNTLLNQITSDPAKLSLDFTAQVHKRALDCIKTAIDNTMEDNAAAVKSRIELELANLSPDLNPPAMVEELVQQYYNIQQRLLDTLMLAIIEDESKPKASISAERLAKYQAELSTAAIDFDKVPSVFTKYSEIMGAGYSDSQLPYNLAVEKKYLDKREAYINKGLEKFDKEHPMDENTEDSQDYFSQRDAEKARLMQNADEGTIHDSLMNLAHQEVGDVYGKSVEYTFPKSFSINDKGEHEVVCSCGHHLAAKKDLMFTYTTLVVYTNKSADMTGKICKSVLESDTGIRGSNFNPYKEIENPQSIVNNVRNVSNYDLQMVSEARSTDGSRDIKLNISDCYSSVCSFHKVVCPKCGKQIVFSQPVMRWLIAYHLNNIKNSNAHLVHMTTHSILPDIVRYKGSVFNRAYSSFVDELAATTQPATTDEQARACLTFINKNYTAINELNSDEGCPDSMRSTVLNSDDVSDILNYDALVNYPDIESKLVTCTNSDDGLTIEDVNRLIGETEDAELQKEWQSTLNKLKKNKLKNILGVSSEDELEDAVVDTLARYDDLSLRVKGVSDEDDTDENEFDVTEVYDMIYSNDASSGVDDFDELLQNEQQISSSIEDAYKAVMSKYDNRHQNTQEILTSTSISQKLASAKSRELSDLKVVNHFFVNEYRPLSETMQDSGPHTVLRVALLMCEEAGISQDEIIPQKLFKMISPFSYTEEGDITFDKRDEERSMAGFDTSDVEKRHLYNLLGPCSYDMLVNIMSIKALTVVNLWQSAMQAEKGILISENKVWNIQFTEEDITACVKAVNRFLQTLRGTFSESYSVDRVYRPIDKDSEFAKFYHSDFTKDELLSYGPEKIAEFISKATTKYCNLVSSKQNMLVYHPLSCDNARYNHIFDYVVQDPRYLGENDCNAAFDMIDSQSAWITLYTDLLICYLIVYAPGILSRYEELFKDKSKSFDVDAEIKKRCNRITKKLVQVIDETEPSSATSTKFAHVLIYANWLEDLGDPDNYFVLARLRDLLIASDDIPKELLAKENTFVSEIIQSTSCLNSDLLRVVLTSNSKDDAMAGIEKLQESLKASTALRDEEEVDDLDKAVIENTIDHLLSDTLSYLFCVCDTTISIRYLPKWIINEIK